MQDEGERLGPTQPAVGADQLLEGRDLAGLRVEGAVDHQIGAVGESVGSSHMLGRVRAKRGEWVLALDAVAVEIVRAARPEHDGPLLL